jgi:outer membrane murein-binding lipoprotein Lpp
MGSPEIAVTIGAVLIIFLIVSAVLWLIVLFAVFGTKAKLDEIISESQKINSWLEKLVAKHQKMNSLLSEIMSESKRLNAWMSGMKTETKTAEESPDRTENMENANHQSDDKRKHPRLDFQCTGMIMGKEAVITDLSLGGVFLEPDEIPELLKIGQVANIDIDLPTESLSTRMKVKIVSQNERGFGCKFVDLSQDNMRAINNCFDEFKNTLPIRDIAET